MNGDGSATVLTGAQENGSGAVMAMPVFVGQELGIDPKDVSILYQDTDVAPWDMGSCGSQTTFNSGRAILAAAEEVREQLLDAAADQLEADRDDIELADGVARVKGSPDRSVAIADLVGEIGTVHGKGSGEVPEAPTGDTGGCVGRLGNETFLAPQLITQAAHVKVDRETGRRPRAARRRRARLRPDPQQGRAPTARCYGGVVMGVGLALSEGTMLDDEGHQRNPHLLDYKLVTCSDAPEIEVEWIEYDSVGPRGSKGVGEPPQVPTAGAIANAITKVLGGQVPTAADDARARLGGARGGRAREPLVHLGRPRVEEALAGHGTAARARSPAAPTSSSARGRARRRFPTRSSRSTASTGSTASVTTARRCVLGTLVTHDDLVADTTRPPAANRARRRDARSSGSHATRAQGTIGGNVMNASPAMDTGGPLLCLDATVTLRSRVGGAHDRPRRAVDRAGQTSARRPTSC